MNSELLNVLECSNASIKIEVSGEDLKHFAEFLLNRGAEMARDNLLSQDSYLSKKDVLEKFGVCDTTLWHWQRTGYLVPRKIGRKILYSKADVDSLLSERR